MKKNFVKMIYEICEEKGLTVQSFSYDWIFSIRTQDNRNAFLVGYQFGLNPASVDSICCDKSAASAILSSLNIPNVEHTFFAAPTEKAYLARSGDWGRMTELLSQYQKIVCKANEGFGGEQVFLVENQVELEVTAHRIFRECGSMAISPYYDILNEYRAIVLNGEVRLLYRKQRPTITGDGVSTLGELLLKHAPQTGFAGERYGDTLGPLDRIPSQGERIPLTWKHNLGQGARAVPVEGAERTQTLTTLAKTVAGEMNLRFASIDIIECEDGYRILELNSGVMMEQFSRQSQQCYDIAKKIYGDAISAMLKESDK